MLDSPNIADLDEIKYVQCTPAAACLQGDQCAVGYETKQDSCERCSDRYYELNGECEKCPENSAMWLVIYIIAILIGGLLSVVVMKKGPSVAVLGLGVDYYQIMAIFIRVSSSESASSLFKVVGRFCYR